MIKGIWEFFTSKLFSLSEFLSNSMASNERYLQEVTKFQENNVLVSYHFSYLNRELFPLIENTKICGKNVQNVLLSSGIRKQFTLYIEMVPKRLESSAECTHVSPT